MPAICAICSRFGATSCCSIFGRTDGPACRDQLKRLQIFQSQLASAGLRTVGINVDDPSDPQAVRAFAAKQGLTFPILLADPDTAAIYNIVYRYLFSRHRDLPLPTSFLIDAAGNIVKVYQELFPSEQLLKDLKGSPSTSADRVRKALPFAGALFQDEFERNSFTYGVAFFQHGFLDRAAESFQQVIADKPDDPEAYYNLGTVYLRRNSLA